MSPHVQLILFVLLLEDYDARRANTVGERCWRSVLNESLAPRADYFHISSCKLELSTLLVDPLGPVVAVLHDLQGSAAIAAVDLLVAWLPDRPA